MRNFVIKIIEALQEGKYKRDVFYHFMGELPYLFFNEKVRFEGRSVKFRNTNNKMMEIWLTNEEYAQVESIKRQIQRKEFIAAEQRSEITLYIGETECVTSMENLEHKPMIIKGTLESCISKLRKWKEKLKKLKSFCQHHFIPQNFYSIKHGNKTTKKNKRKKVTNKKKY